MNTQIVFEQIIQRGCGMDVHRDTVVATVMEMESKRKLELIIPIQDHLQS